MTLIIRNAVVQDFDNIALLALDCQSLVFKWGDRLKKDYKMRSLCIKIIITAFMQKQKGKLRR